MKLFVLNRIEDESGVSGTGIVADGVVFPSGKCVVCFRPKPHSVTVYNNIDEVEQVHGHGGKTLIVWAAENQLEGLAEALSDFDSRLVAFLEAVKDEESKEQV